MAELFCGCKLKGANLEMCALHRRYLDSLPDEESGVILDKLINTLINLSAYASL